MKYCIRTLLIAGFVLFVTAGDNNMKFKPLTEAEKAIIIDKGTEAPYSGKYYNFDENGVYTCKRCGADLYRSTDKFDAGCGWPSFDAAIPNAIKKVPDADGRRTEILCANCGGHLGHVFTGEAFTPRNTRYCVNSLSLDFKAAAEDEAIETAVFASGCFWGTEFYFQKAQGVISTTVGYTGGKLENPDYQAVSSGTSGHVEAVKVTFDPEVISYEELTKLFFETHDPTQKNGQGPDIGTQYLSKIFYFDDEQKKIAEDLIGHLRNKGFDVATQLLPAAKFWEAEAYHQDYYQNNGETPYCHFYRKLFDE